MQRPNEANPPASPPFSHFTLTETPRLFYQNPNNGPDSECAHFLPSRKCSVMRVLVFTGRYQTRPVG